MSGSIFLRVQKEDLRDKGFGGVCKESCVTPSFSFSLPLPSELVKERNETAPNDKPRDLLRSLLIGELSLDASVPAEPFALILCELFTLRTLGESRTFDWGGDAAKAIELTSDDKRDVEVSGIT